MTCTAEGQMKDTRGERTESRSDPSVSVSLRSSGGLASFLISFSCSDIMKNRSTADLWREVESIVLSGGIRVHQTRYAAGRVLGLVRYKSPVARGSTMEGWCTKM